MQIPLQSINKLDIDLDNLKSDYTSYPNGVYSSHPKLGEINNAVDLQWWYKGEKLCDHPSIKNIWQNSISTYGKKLSVTKLLMTKD